MATRTYDEHEKVAFDNAPEGIELTPRTRINMRLQAAFNYAFSCEMVEAPPTGLEGGDVALGLAEGFAAAILNLYENTQDQCGEASAMLVVTTVLAIAADDVHDSIKRGAKGKDVGFNRAGGRTN